MGERWTTGARPTRRRLRSVAWIVAPLALSILGVGSIAGPSSRTARWSPDTDRIQPGVNPVDVVRRSPDPDVPRTQSAYVIYSTDLAGDAGVFPIRTSLDLHNWSEVGYLVPDGAPRPMWWSPRPDDPCKARDSGRPRYWGPDVFKAGNRYVAYYSATGRSSRTPSSVSSIPPLSGTRSRTGIISCGRTTPTPSAKEAAPPPS